MDYRNLIFVLQNTYGLQTANIKEPFQDEVHLVVSPTDFGNFCMALHKELKSPVMALFAQENKDTFTITCLFLGAKYQRWFFVVMDIGKDQPCFNSIAKEIYSAHLFEREIKEMFGIEPLHNPDTRRLRLHDEVWPNGSFPLRKNFQLPVPGDTLNTYSFTHVEGDGIFEIPVGPVHAGIIGPGHFRFSVAGEPIINLEIRLGFTHRGIEKLMEGKAIPASLKIAECIAGDAAFSHSWAHCMAVEKICGINVPERARQIRTLLLELERMYNHVADIGAIALDVGFSYPAALASIIKENLHQLNADLCGQRYLKNINVVGGITLDIDISKANKIITIFKTIKQDFDALKDLLKASPSFMDRVDTTGYLRKKTVEDLGVLGVVGRASGIAIDLRKIFTDVYAKLNFNVPVSERGDVLARLNMRIQEFSESLNMLQQIIHNLSSGSIQVNDFNLKAGRGLGYVESWRGPVLHWVDLDKEGIVQRHKIIDPSFRNWQGLAYAVLENIVPDFPVCNKSFNLSYAGNDL